MIKIKLSIISNKNNKNNPSHWNKKRNVKYKNLKKKK